MKIKELKEMIAIPKGVEVKAEKGLITAKGQKGECKKMLFDPKINIEVKEGNVVFTAKNATKKQKTGIWTFRSHTENLMKGAAEGHVYSLKICSGHFPMNVSVSGKEFIVNNFLGEKNPRKLQLKDGVDVKVEGDKVTVESCSKELAGQTAADIETLTKITNRDLRIFQDGIYITEKDGVPVR
jgi:large subunit ribosomal protein L6